MLYQLYDWQRAALEPWRALAQATNEFYGHGMSPFSYMPGSRNVAAAMDLMGRLTQRYERPAFGYEPVKVDGREFAVREAFELEKPFCRLLHFVKDGAPAQPKVQCPHGDEPGSHEKDRHQNKEPNANSPQRDGD